MNDKSFLLSICIPTFNRLHYLRDSLEFLLPQAQQHDVEVCISDNHSTDGTADYLAEKASCFSCLSYVVQGENIGLDKNMVAVILMGVGRYIFPLGDDDVLLEGSVLLLLKELDAGADLVILNGWHTDALLSPKNNHLTVDLQGNVISSPSDAFCLLWDKMPFGSFLASRDCFSVNYFDRFIGTSHAYTGAVWDVLGDKYRSTGLCKVMCMSEPTVLLRGGEKTWRNDAAKIMIYGIPKWFSLIIQNDVYTVVGTPIRTLFMNKTTSIMSLLRFRAIGQLDFIKVEAMAKECSHSQVQRMYLIARLPRCLVTPVISVLDGLKRSIKRFIR